MQTQRKTYKLIAQFFFLIIFHGSLNIYHTKRLFLNIRFNRSSSQNLRLKRPNSRT